MTVLVTGGAGLVGSHVLDALRVRGERALALVRPASRAAVEALGAAAVAGDVTDPAAWQRALAQSDVRGIVHAAALVAPRAPFSEFERVNVGGTRLAIAAAQRSRARLVHVSSVAVYGRSAIYDSSGVDEDFAFQPLPERDFYARTKRMADELVRAAGGVAIRPNVIYGERDRLFTPRVLATVRRGVIPQIGTGRNQLSCVYAGNVASAILAALDAPAVGGPKFRAYNVTHDAPPHFTQREFLGAFATAAGTRARFIRAPLLAARAGVWLWNAWLRTLYPKRYGGLAGAAVSFITSDNPFSSARIRSELGWQPPFDTKTAIGRTVAYSVR